jgi:hypothetical protein
MGVSLMSLALIVDNTKPDCLIYAYFYGLTALRALGTAGAQRTRNEKQ